MKNFVLLSFFVLPFCLTTHADLSDADLDHAVLESSVVSSKVVVFKMYEVTVPGKPGVPGVKNCEDLRLKEEIDRQIEILWSDRSVMKVYKRHCLHIFPSYSFGNSDPIATQQIEALHVYEKSSPRPSIGFSQAPPQPQ